MMVKIVRPVEFWLEQIVYWGDRLRGHCDGYTEIRFLGDLKAIDASCWCISCVGEAAGRILQLDPDFEQRRPELELTAAYTTRNRLSHGYYRLDNEQIWDTASASVPKLVEAARQLLANEH
jgi:uncharacterized protein with HEPN domain